MTTDGAQPPEPPAQPTPAEAVEVRIAALRAEIEADEDVTRQATLHYEVGHLLETEVGNDAMAVREYLTAYNLDATFRPPLFALVRIFERRRSFKNLMRLHQAEARSAQSPDERASALVDQGVLLEDHQGQPGEARGLYEQALEADGSHLAAALMLERHARAAGDAQAAQRAVETLAHETGDPVLKGLLLGEMALDREANGDIDGAIDALEQAVALPLARWRLVDWLERIARRNGRTAELVKALEAKAAMAAAIARGEDHGQSSGTFAVRRFAAPDEARTHAVALWHEAARLRLAEGEAEAALGDLDRALELHGSDSVLRQQHMLAAEMVGDTARATEDARVLIEAGVSGPFAAALQFHVAELAQTSGDGEGARAALAAAVEANPSSAAALATLDDLLMDAGDDEKRVARLERQAEGLEGSAPALLLWRAAQIALERSGDFERAAALYRRAADAAEQPTTILRELHASARRAGADETARDAAKALLDAGEGGEVDEEERSALLRDLYDLSRVAPDPDAELTPETVLTRALDDPASLRWAADAARIHAAWHGDDALLARAHRVLADRAPRDETAAAHMCAAARAFARAGDEERASQLLREAIDRVPGHRYAVALLEEILRARGEADEVVSLLREAAASNEGSRTAETSLLLAGAAAEAAGDTATAAQTYEEAADHDPTAVAPLWALRRLAERQGDDDLRLKSLEALSEREIAEGDPARATLELGEQYDLRSGKPQLAESPLRAALEGPAVMTAAAIDLVLASPAALDPGARIDALERLVEASTEDRLAWLRELAGSALAAEDVERASRAIDQILGWEGEGDGRHWARWARLRTTMGDPQQAGRRADAWVALGDDNRDADATAELVLHGLRAKMMAQGAGAADDAFILAYEIAETNPDATAAAVALDESLGGGDDPESREQALRARLQHSTRAGKAELEAAHGRSLLAAGRAGEAIPVVRRAIEADADDLASWEALRVAAREAGSWEEVVAACDKLAEVASETFRPQLLEESAAALMDHLGRDAEAEKRLRAALEIEDSRSIAYYRLHDLLAEREDTGGLLQIVGQRIDAIDDPEELEKLYYEQARLLRSEGDREGALQALENLLMLDDHNPGGLALAVEIHVSMEQHEQAVQMLRRLAAADVPAKQKRLAHLGAADFLERKMGDPRSAMEELGKVADLGLEDAGLHARIAGVAERAGLWQDAVAALDRAVTLTRGADAAEHARRAGAIRAEQVGDTQAAVASYRKALEEAPTDLQAGDALASLLSDPAEQREVAHRFEVAVRTMVLDEDPTHPEGLRKLRRSATWRQDGGLEHVALSTLVALGEADDAEREQHASLRERMERSETGAPLSETSLSRLRARGDGGPTADLARHAFEGLAALDGLEPAAYGVGRGELVNPKVSNPVRDEVLGLARRIGLPEGDFYVGGSEPGRIAVVRGRKDRPAWIVGTGVKSPLDTRRRFHVGRLAMAMHDGTLPLLGRRPEEGADLLFGAAFAAEAPLEAGRGRAGVEQVGPRLAKTLPRRARRAISDLAPSIPAGGEGVETYCRAAVRTATRAGALLSGDLGPALESVLGGRADRETARASEDARDLIRFWISPTSLALRRELGWTT